MQIIKIKEGNHYSNVPLLKKLKSFKLFTKYSSLTKIVEFTNSATYEVIPEVNDHVNKLFGVSFGFHHKNSVRFGWKANDTSNIITIYSYCYIDGKRIIERMCEVYPNLCYRYRITFGDHKTTFEILKCASGDVICRLVQDSIKQSWFSYRLFPYFGGKSVAPKEITILMN